MAQIATDDTITQLIASGGTNVTVPAVLVFVDETLSLINPYHLTAENFTISEVTGDSGATASLRTYPTRASVTSGYLYGGNLMFCVAAA